MAHRVFRLSISPERAPQVRRVVDFGGRASLHDVHNAIQRHLELDHDHLYAFYLSGRYFDRSSEYGLGQDSRNDSSRSLLFRLKLREGQQFAYLFDFGDEHRHAITVVSITDVEAPLEEPVLVESVGKAPRQYESEEWEPHELPEQVAPIAPLAEAVLTLSERLDELLDEDDAAHEDDEPTSEDEPAGPPEAIVAQLRELATAALQLAGAVKEDLDVMRELDEWSQSRELIPRLVELPTTLVNVGEIDSALAVAPAFLFAAPEPFNADIALALAESGKREEAIAQLESNLKQFADSFVTAVKSGEAFEALGDRAAAEACYRAALELAEDETDEMEAVALLQGLLEAMGRQDEVEALLASSGHREPPGDDSFDDDDFLDDAPPTLATPSVAARAASVGRNEPCPCGSGKKYKKCHGV